jgi:hypothetical protein
MFRVTQIYSDMVLFPLPSCTLMKPRLARELRQILEETQYTELLISNPKGAKLTVITDIFTWIIVMGGIAASFTAHRQFFVNCLRGRVSMGQVDEGVEQSWESFKELVSKFLWWEYVLDVPTMELWSEVFIQEYHLEETEA